MKAGANTDGVQHPCSFSSKQLLLHELNLLFCDPQPQNPSLDIIFHYLRLGSYISHQREWSNMATDQSKNQEELSKPERRYALEIELTPLLNLLNTEPLPEALVTMRDLTINCLRLLDTNEQVARTSQSLGVGALEGLPDALVAALRSAIENGTIARIKQCRCGKYFFQRLPKQRFCGEECPERRRQLQINKSKSKR